MSETNNSEKTEVLNQQSLDETRITHTSPTDLSSNKSSPQYASKLGFLKTFLVVTISLIPVINLIYGLYVIKQVSLNKMNPNYLSIVSVISVLGYAMHFLIVMCWSAIISVYVGGLLQ